MRTSLVVAALGLLMPACIGDYGPDVGEPQREACANADSDADVEISYSRDIFDGILNVARPTRCLNCHDPGADTPIGYEIGGLDLTTYESLRRGGVRSGGGIVMPGQPCDSILAQKVGAGPPFGSRMPYNGPPYLTDAEQLAIHDWIAEGAKDN